ncbi:MAG: hypothetical protein FD146_2358 [Anaerolineaceae bacterium]|nr:MAG: hypothetical protein FD146_2358 [Anaerolineaceae bacterium]
MKISPLDRILLLLTGLLAAYHIVVGIEGFASLPAIAYTIAFGVLLIAGLLLILLGFDVLDSPIIVIVSTIIPLSLATGLVWQYLASFGTLYLGFAILGFLAVTITRALPIKTKLPVLVLGIVHGLAGLTIFLLPIIWVLTGRAAPGFALVGIGGALIGIGGLLLSFLKAGKPLLSRAVIFRLLPGLLLLMTAAFVAGFAFAS